MNYKCTNSEEINSEIAHCAVTSDGRRRGEKRSVCYSTTIVQKAGSNFELPATPLNLTPGGHLVQFLRPRNYRGWLRLIPKRSFSN